MAHVQVDIPEDLFAFLSARGLSVTEVVTNALRAEQRRLQILEETDAYLEQLEAEVGEPTPAECADAREFVDRVKQHLRDSPAEKRAS